jgi:hypothetical protein
MMGAGCILVGMRDESKDNDNKGRGEGDALRGNGEDEAEETITLREEVFDDAGHAEPYRDE